MVNKKSQIAATLNWFIAFIIIFFIILLFISASIIIAGKKEMPTIGVGGDTIGVVKYGFEDLEAQRSLISFLETPIKIDDKKMKIKNLILISLDPYIEDETGIYFERFKLWDKSIMKKLEGDINKLSTIRPQISQEFFIKNQVKLKDETLFEKSQEILPFSCSEYMLSIPQGVILLGRTDFALNEEFETSAWKEILISKWTPWAEIQLPYKRQIIKIKFRELKKC